MPEQQTARGDVGRLFRWQGSRWDPIDEPLPGFTHAPPQPQQPLANWILPRSIEARSGDVVAWGELAHQLLSPVPSHDPALEAIIDQARPWMGAAELSEWLQSIEVWLGFRLRAGGAWPVPSRGE